ncbi:MAG: hypothetical protein ACE5H2_04505 [Terriglobia bacterium]
MSERLEKMRAELANYQHPLFQFTARALGDDVEIALCLRTSLQDVPDVRASKDFFLPSFQYYTMSVKHRLTYAASDKHSASNNMRSEGAQRGFQFLPTRRHTSQESNDQ